MAPKLKPPSKPGKDATLKALASYHAELRRYARTLDERDTKLQKLDALLRTKEQLLEQKAEMLDALLADEDCFCVEGTCNIHPNQDGEIDKGDPDHRMLECGCSVYDAKNGCECPHCEQWRKSTGMSEDDLMDMDMCKFDDWIEKRRLTVVNGVTGEEEKFFEMTGGEEKFFDQYEQQMKVKE